MKGLGISGAACSGQNRAIVQGIPLSIRGQTAVGISTIRPRTFSEITFLPTLNSQLIMGKPETRNYKAVFFLGKSEIGLESDVAEATARP
jgi:hypothetical protein